MQNNNKYPAVGIGYRPALDSWTRKHLDQFDVLEITIDHWIYGSGRVQHAILDLVENIPLTAHGVGLSLGTDVPLDLNYLDQVADIVHRLRVPAYSEHLAFTRVPGLDLANLLPLPQTEAVAETIIAKIQTVQSRVGLPFLLENITYVFTWPDSQLNDAQFLNLICRATGAGLLLDVENLYLNSCNHRFDPYAFVDALPSGLVKEVHMAGGQDACDERMARSVLADSHAYPVTAGALELLEYVLARQSPATIVLERDDRFEAIDEVLDDVARIRACVTRTHGENARVKPAA
jgi:uncharacterized protein